MKSKQELIESLQETKKAMINQVNKSKQEIQKEAKKLYNKIDMIAMEEVKTQNMEFTRIREPEKPKNKMRIIIKPQVCTLFSLKAMTIKPTQGNNNLKPVFTISTNRLVYIEQKEFKKAGKLLFSNVKWLPTIKLKDQYNINKIPITIDMKEFKEDAISKYGLSDYKTMAKNKSKYRLSLWSYEREYHCQGIVKISQIKSYKFESNQPEIQEKINYIEKINRRIKGANQLTHYYQSQYELAVAGMKSLNILFKANEELDFKKKIKEGKIMQLNKITQENIKNNRAKVNKIKNEIKDLKKKRKKNVEKYQDARYKLRHVINKRSEIGNKYADSAYAKINAAYSGLERYKQECYGKIRRAAERNDIELKIDGFDHYN
jgi:hypothetical protein